MGLGQLALLFSLLSLTGTRANEDRINKLNRYQTTPNVHPFSAWRNSQNNTQWQSDETKIDPLLLSDENGEFGIHSVPGLSHVDVNGSLAGWAPTPDAPDSPVDGPLGEPIWNDEGQYWGYPLDQPTTMQMMPLNDTGDCVPPFCIPVNCTSSRGNSCNFACNIKTANCDLPCQNGGTCNNGSCCCRNGFVGELCQVMTRNLCHLYYRMDCQIGCLSQPSHRMQQSCICNPWRNQTSNCTAVELDLLKCPQGCNGRGYCIPNSGQCICDVGYAGKTCELMDFCSNWRRAPRCQYKCENSETGPICVCPYGETLAPDGLTCMKPNTQSCPEGLAGRDCRDDIDECLTGSHKCAQDCTNTYGSYRCSCRNGFEVDPRNSYSCIRKKDDYYDCQPKCVEDQGYCENKRCVCYYGFYGPDCRMEENICKTKRPCQHECNFLGKGRFECSCHSGYRPSIPGDASRCVPQLIDECKTGAHNCSQLCIDRPNGFECACYPDYEPYQPGDPSRCVKKQVKHGH
ncbi:hypothetical protein Ciccas_008730 [Cichlidogyrus casuarinus]|uniref:EGF-like domain-containing protein n=1 Tax=Cichlidogyrus casuarinus TaxID=1844966 RepID=A0ABD2PZ58_9PLAT